MLKKFSFVAALLAVLAPMLSHAQSSTIIIGGAGGQANSTHVLSLFQLVANIIGALVPIIIGLAIVYFMWGVVSYILAKSDDTKKEGKNRIIYGFIALFIIVSFWGIIKFLGTTTGVSQVGGSSGVNCLLNPSQLGC